MVAEGIEGRDVSVLDDEFRAGCPGSLANV
jgi:hypothetical protein